MARKLSRSTISGLMADWGRKGGCRATEAQKNAARKNLKQTPNYKKHIQLTQGKPHSPAGKAAISEEDLSS